MFQPYQHRINIPRASEIRAPQTMSSQRQIASVIVPLGVILDLALMPASGTRDYFLWLPYGGSLQDVVLGADRDVDLPANFSCQLIQIQEGRLAELNTQQSVGQLTLEPTTLPTPSAIGEGPVFLRVNSTAANQLVFVTLYILTSEIP